MLLHTIYTINLKFYVLAGNSLKIIFVDWHVFREPKSIIPGGTKAFADINFKNANLFIFQHFLRQAPPNQVNHSPSCCLRLAQDKVPLTTWLTDGQQHGHPIPKKKTMNEPPISFRLFQVADADAVEGMWSRLDPFASGTTARPQNRSIREFILHDQLRLNAAHFGYPCWVNPDVSPGQVTHGSWFLGCVPDETRCWLEPYVSPGFFFLDGWQMVF